MEKGKSYGIEFENDIRRYLECMVVHGADFDEARGTAWAGAILGKTDLNGTEKMDEIANYELFAIGE